MGYAALGFGAVVEILAPRGWVVYGRWPAAETTRIVGLARRGATDDEIDQAVTKLWHTHGEVWLRNVAIPLRRYGRLIHHEFQVQQFQRANLVDQAVKCHFAGYYAAATLLTYAQIDGLTRDITGATFFSDSQNDPYIDDTTLAGIEGNLPVVRRFFSESVTETGFHGKLSRHGATHGRDLSFGTQATSTKALVLLGALIEYLEERSQGVARQRKREHDQRVSGLTGVEESGRLQDDRSFDDLYFFSVDLDADIFPTALGGDAPPASWRERARSLMEERGLAKRRLTWGGADSSSYWWYYKTPAGQFMGAGSRRYGAGLPVDWRRWLWDAAEPPTGAPWESNGWQEYDGNQGTPNWTILPFPSEV